MDIGFCNKQLFSYYCFIITQQALKMKTYPFTQTLFSFLLILSMISCNKETAELMDAETEQDVISVGVEELVALAHARYLAGEVTVEEGEIGRASCRERV